MQSCISASVGNIDVRAAFDKVTRVVLCLLLFPAGMIAVGWLLGISDGYWSGVVSSFVFLASFVVS